jgi:hypothetical protein
MMAQDGPGLPLQGREQFGRASSHQLLPLLRNACLELPPLREPVATSTERSPQRSRVLLGYAVLSRQRHAPALKAGLVMGRELDRSKGSGKTHDAERDPGKT